MASPQIALVHVDVLEPERDAFIAKSLENATNSRREPENQRFDLLQSKDDPNKFVLLEIYATEQGPADHKKTAHYSAWREGVESMMASPRKGVQYESCFPPSPGMRTLWHSCPSGWTEEGPVDFTLVYVKVKPGTEAAFKAASAENASNSVREPGNLRFDCIQERADPTSFVLIEVYKTAAESAKHKETAHYLKWREVVADMMAEPRQGKKYTPIGDAGSWHWAVLGSISGKAPPEPELVQLVPKLPLLDGRSMPALGFGCYKVGRVPGSATGGASGAPLAPATQVISDALAAGYRCFDCAQFYENEAEVGEAFEASGVPRSELFIISKVWGNKVFEGPAAVREQCLRTLRDLRTDYLDMYLVHWPVPGKHVEAYKAILALQAEGLVRSVGVSNYTVEDLEELTAAGLALPSVNQIEINPFLYRKKTIAHFEALGIRLQAYRALCNFGKSENEVVVSVAKKHNRSAAHILGRWTIQKGFQHIPKSEKRFRMDDNAKLFDFSLDQEDLEKLDNLTTPAALETFRSTYVRCVYRDTPMEGSTEGIKDFTVD